MDVVQEWLLSQSKWELFGLSSVVFPLPAFHGVSGSPRKPCVVRSILEWAEVCLRKARFQVNQKKTRKSQGCSLKSEEPDWEDQDQIVMTAWRQLGGVKKLDNLWLAREVASPFLVCIRAQGKEQISLLVLFSVYAALLFTDFRLFLAVFLVAFASRQKWGNNAGIL